MTSLKNARCLVALTTCGLLLSLSLAAPGPAAALSPAWTRTWNGDLDGDDAGRGVALGADGSVYVAGEVEIAAEGGNAALRKYSPAGARLWTRTYNGPGNDYDTAAGVAVAPDGSVYLAGHTWSRDYSDILVQKYSPAGVPIWSQTIDVAGGDDVGNAVAVGPDGSVYVAGSTGSDLLLQKLSEGGAPAWTRTIAGATARGVATDGDGSVYVAGTTGESFLLVKYSDAGDTLWTRTHDGISGGCAVAVGPDHSVVAVGFARVTNGHDYLLVRKYDADGNLAWSRITPAGSSLYGYAYGNAVAVSRTGRIFVAGSFELYGKPSHIILRSFQPGGASLGAATFNTRGFDRGYGVAVGRTGAVVVTGEIEPVPGGGTAGWVRKYR
jgi:uncharacterized delta-60 repeat protein